MVKHSKNSTASSIFSYAEYKRLDYGTKRQRLGNESMRRFDACSLCLNRAREPLACNEGHLFCKECVYTDLLTQKKDMKRQKEKLQAMQREVEEEKTRAKEAARERVLLDFEKGQLGLASKSLTGMSSSSSSSATSKGGNSSKNQDVAGDSARGTKRKFAFDSTTVENLAREAEEAALREIEREQAEALRSKLPDFWLPSLTPTYSSSGPPQSLLDVKLQTTCRGGAPTHSLALKNLIPVHFTFESTSSSAPSRSAESTPAAAEGGDPSSSSSATSRPEDVEPMCPSCKKRLSNSTLVFVMKPCGHVVCKTCTDLLVKPASQCIVCDCQLKEGSGGGGSGDIIELRREGTGFAGGGLAETSKKGIAFQG